MFWLEIKRAIKRRYGWHYVITDNRSTVEVRWFWTYNACIKALKRDVADGRVHWEVQMLGQNREGGSASMIYDIRKEM